MVNLYNGLLMGCSAQYWKDICNKIVTCGEFAWTDVHTKYPEITRKNLSRLQHSGYIIKIRDEYHVRNGKKVIRKIWKINPAYIQKYK